MDIDKFYAKAYDWIIREGPKILLAIVVFAIAEWLLRILKRWVRRAMDKKQFDTSLQPFLISLLFTILQVLLILALMQFLGIQMTIFAALIGGAGVAAGLALSGTLQNFTSGILILLLRPYRVGDNIIAQGQEGTVRSIQIFYTILVSYDEKDVIIPNSKLSNDLIVNLSQEGRRRMDLTIKFPFAADYTLIEKTVRQTLGSKSVVLKDPQPRVGIASLDPDGFQVSVNAWVPPHGFTDAKLELQVALLDNLKKAGIKFPGM